MKKKILNISTKIIIATLLLIALATPTFAVNAAGYTYDFWKNVIPCADGLSLSDVFYQNDIKNANSEDKSPVSFDTLTDLATYVYEDTAHPENSIYEIYVLDSNKFTDTVVIPGSTPETNVKVKGLSSVFILNQDFQKVEEINEFLITDEVKDILDKHYGFNTPLSQINEKHYTSTEFIDFYGQTQTFQFLKSDFENDLKVITGQILDFGNLLNKVVIKINGVEKARSYIRSKIIGSDTELYLNLPYDEIALVKENDRIEIEFTPITTIGKAPYYPYSKDDSKDTSKIKAAIRLSNASGIARTKDGLYVADSSNARIIRANKNEEGLWIVDRVYLTPEDNVFYQVESGIAISDTVGKTVFNPQKVVVDKTGKVYCIAKNVYEGIIEFDAGGSFNRFLGKNEVVANPLKKFWGKIFSEKQLDSLALDLPPEFTNIAIDSSGFLYATSNPDDDSKATKMVKMINTAGNDVLKRNGYVTPDGDAVYVAASTEAGVVIGASKLVGVTVSDNGNYTVVDQKHGRLFTYDSEGNLLYTTGKQPGGSQTTSTSENIVSPVSINYFTRTSTSLAGVISKEEVLLVLDQSSKSIMLYETTEFGEKVNSAIDKYQKGVFEDIKDSKGNVIEYGSEHYWEEVLKMNENYELAHLGIGKAQYRRGDYKDAMDNFKLAHNANYYSKAYAEYRDSILSANFSWIMTGVIMLVMLWIVLSYRKYLTEKNQKLAASAAMNEEKYNILSGNISALHNKCEEISSNEENISSVEETLEEKKKNFLSKIDWAKIWQSIKNFFHEVFGVPLYILTHPVQGFTEFKTEKKGKMWVAVTVLLIYVLVEIIAYQYEGIVTNKNNPQNFNSIRILVYGVLPPVILAIANWSVTTLLDGKGKMKEIFMMICYSLIPIILINVLNIILSNVLTSDEAQFITILNIIGWVITGFMVFMGLVVIHEYGMGKTIWSIILTILATLIIAFLALLIFDLAQQIYGFVYSLYKEITTRYF